MNVHNILYVLICQNILSKNQKKNSFKTYVIYGRQDSNCVDRMHDLLDSSCFHCRDPECHHDEKRTKRFTDSTHVLIPLRSNFIFKPCFNPLPQRTLFSEWFCLRTNFVITAHQHTAGSFDVRFLSLRIYLYSRMKMEKQINF